jgi:hypothetical protein
MLAMPGTSRSTAPCWNWCVGRRCAPHPAGFVWLEAGTLFGWLRHRSQDDSYGGIIPTDDDVDLGYFIAAPRDGDPFHSLVETFACAGLTLQRNRTDAYWQVGTNPVGTVISEIHLDLFPFVPDQDADVGTTYVCADPRFREESPDSTLADCNTKYGAGELFPLRPGLFYDMEVLVPNLARQVVMRALGEDCMEVARVRVGGRDDGHVEEYQLRDKTPA